MAFDIFTKEELSVAWVIVKYGFYILVITAIVTTTIRFALVYAADGQAGLMNLIREQVVVGPDTVDTQKSLKQDLENHAKNNAPIIGELPQYLEVPSLGINTAVESPEVISVTVLDNALARGPVYYQGSGTPGNRNMLIFGHSTGFSIVNNKAYKVFNNIKLAKKGEYVYVRTSSGIHTYVIQNVKKVSKYSTWIQFDSDKPLLTLSTCDSFGKKSDRWVLEASYVGFKKY